MLFFVFSAVLGLAITFPLLVKADGGSPPVLTKASGDAQVVAANAFESAPLVIQLTDSTGSPLANTPVGFAIPTGSDGGLSATSGGAINSTANVTTDANGNASVYYEAGSEVLQNNTITVTEGTGTNLVTASFTAHCGLQNGLSSWLLGDVGVTADTSSNVSQWQDQSPSTNGATQATNGIQPQLVSSSLNGHSVIRFDGSTNYLAMPPCIAGDFTVVVVFRSADGTGTGGQWSNAGGMVDAFTATGANDFGMGLDQNGELLTGVGNPDTSIVSTLGGFNDGNGHIATFTRTEASGAFSQYIDSILQGSQSGNTSPLTSPPQITIGATQTLTNYFGGDVAEVLLFNRTLSAAEQAQLEGFLADKYGLYSPNATWPMAYGSEVQAEIMADHWTKSQADAYVAFTAGSPAVPSKGLLVWLEANAGITTDNSGNVQQWVDQSPSGHVAYTWGQIPPPVLQNDSNGNPTLVFSGGQVLVSPDYIPANQDLTMIAVSANQNPQNFTFILTLGGLNNLNQGETRSYVDNYGSADFDLYYDGCSSGQTSAANEQAVESVTFQRDSGAVNFYLRGNYNGYGNVSANDLSSGLFVGDSPDSNCPFSGTISELLVYNRILSGPERQQTEAYLANKYGLYDPNIAWPLSFSPDVQQLITENQWSKAQANAYVASLGNAVRAPTVSVAPGYYPSTQTITVTSATSDATIYYTTDGTTPTTGSASIANGGQVTVSSTAQLQFLAADGTLPNSSVTAAVYQVGNVGSLVAGDSFTMVQKPDGTVWTWGGDWRGQQGDNQQNSPAAVPQQVPNFTGAAMVAAAGDHALAVKTDGTVWAWGADDLSQCGDGGTNDLYVPTQISGLSSIASVFAGQANGFAVDGSGNLYGWGDNTYGQLGDGTTNRQGAPEPITSVTNVVKVASSANFTLVLKSDGTVWASGSNGSGELGDGTYNDENSFQQVPGLSGVKDIAVGNYHALAMLSNGTVWSWGDGGYGELGHGNYSGLPGPRQIVGLPSVVAIAAANAQSFVVLGDGTVRGFGFNGQNQLGLGTSNAQDQATPISPSGVGKVTMLAAGGYHTVICTTTGAFYGWGDNSNYRLTQDFAANNFSSATEVHDSAWSGFTSVVSAENSTLGLKNDGTVWGVGEGDNGVLGQGDWYPAERPVQATGLTNVSMIAAGYQSAFAVRSDGSLWSWGANWTGLLGLGSYNPQNVPAQIPGLQHVTDVAAGHSHMLAIQADGTVWATGDDSQGELGDGTTNDEASPIQVSGLTNPTQVAAGNNTSFVLESDGSVWAWGQNDQGQLGLGTTGNVQSPTKITGLPSMETVVARENNAIGIDQNGNVWNWGTLGNSDGTPLEQTGIANVKTVAAGTYHDLAIESDGTLWGNGAGFLGQLGNGSYNDISTFTQFQDVQGAVDIAGNYASSFLVKQDGSLSGFGNCNNGELAANLGVYNGSPKPLFGIAMSGSPPSLSISSPTTGLSGTVGTAIQFQASASSTSGTITEVDYYLNGVEIGSSTGGGTWSYSWTPSTSGDMTVEAVAIDHSGVAQVSTPIVLAVAPGGSAPSAPTQVTATSGASGNAYLGWRNGSGGSSVLVQKQNSDGSWSTLATLSGSASSYEVSGLTRGQSYNFRVVESNANGTTNSAVAYSSTNGSPPLLTKVSGDQQTIPASSFGTSPVVVQVKDAAGNDLAGVPITFGIASESDGGLALTNGGTGSSTQSVTTDAQGLATLYYQAGPETIQNNTITAATPSGAQTVNVGFTEYCGLSEGLGLWLRADAGVTADGSGNVSAWTDQSPSQNNASQTNTGSSPSVISSGIGGFPALAFSGSEYLSVPDSASLRPSQITIMAVYQQQGSQLDQRILCKPYFQGSWNNPYLSYALDAVYWSNDNPGFEVTTNGNDNRLISSQVAQTARPVIATAKYDGSNETLYLQGVQTDILGATGAIDYGDSSPKALCIGMNGGNNGEFFSGAISEILVWTRPLSDTDRIAAEAYLADKYGLYDPNATWLLAYSADVQELISTNQWSKGEADAYVALQAANPNLPLSGLSLWFQANTGVTSDATGDVSQWKDQGIGAHIALQASIGNEPQIVTEPNTGKSALSFNGNQWLSSNDLVPAGNDLTIVAVDSSNNTSNFTIAASLGTYSGGANNGAVRGIGYRANQPEFDLAYGSCQAGAAPVAGAPSINTTTFSRSSGTTTFYTNGALNASGPISGVSATGLSPGFIIGGASWSGNYWTGTISEIMVFNRILTDLERQQAEVYLANRYGLYYPSATWPLAYSSAVQAQITANQWTKVQADAYVAFLATNPPVPASGLSLWLKTDAGLTQNGGSVSSWSDQSPNQNNASPSAVAPAVVSSNFGGGSAVHFDGSGNTYLTIPDSPSLRPNTYTVLAVATEDSRGSSQYLLSRPYRSGGAYGGWTPPFMSYGMTMDQNNTTYLGSFVTPVGSSIVPTNGANTYSVGQPHQLGWVYDGSNQEAYTDGSTTAVASAATNGNIDYSGGSANVVIGIHSSTDLRGTLNEPLNGDVYEILVYNRALSPTEMQQAEGYLADKYGLSNPNATWQLAYSPDVQAQIAANGWTKAQADAYVAFVASNPSVPVSGLALWLKSDTGITTDSSGNVSAWTDQSPFSNNANQGNGSIRPSLVTGGAGGLPILHFTGNQYLSINDSSTLHGSTQTVFAVAQENSTQTYQTLFARGYYTSGGWNYPFVTTADCLFGVNGGNYLRSAVTTGGGLTEADGGNTYDTTKPHVFDWRYDGSNQQMFVSGNMVTETGTTGALDYSGGNGDYVLGSRSDVSPGEFLVGDVSELLVYNRSLTETERDQVEQYLANRYGLYEPNASWPLSYSTEVQAEITRNQWSKAQTDAYVAFQANNPGMLTNGLGLWLKADSGVTQDGNGNVSSWADQTGNYTLTQTGSTNNMPQYQAGAVNGKPALQFNGNQWMHNGSGMGPGLNSDMTIITVGSTSSPQSQQYSLWLGATGTGQNRGIGYYNSAGIADTFNIYLTGGVVPPANTFGMEACTLDNARQNLTLFQNGTQVATTSVSGLQDIQNGISVGTLYNYGCNWQGDIAEVLVYDHQLSAAEMAQVDGYLADKYGYYSPNATWPMAYNAATQSEIAAGQLNQQQAAAYASFLSENPAVPASGLRLWLKADTGVTTDSSGGVSQWIDKTIFGNNANQSTASNRPSLISSRSDLNGEPVIRFNGSSTYLDITDNATLKPANAVTVIAAAQTYSTAQQDLVDRSLTYNFYGYWTLAPYYSYDLGFDPNNVEHGYVATNGGTDVSSPTILATQMSVSTMVYNGTSATIYNAGTVQATSGASGAIDYDGTNQHDLLIGAGANFRGNINYFTGDVAEVLVYDRVLSPAEQQQAEVYLADKYGIYDPNATWPLAYDADVQAQINANGWNKSEADAYVAVAAASPSFTEAGLALWLKADTGVTADSNGNVSQWSDQSPFQNNANQPNTGNQPTLITTRTDLNGEPVIRFNGSSSYLDVSDTPNLRPSGPMTVIALSQNNGSGEQDVVSHPLTYNYYGYWDLPPYFSYEFGSLPNNVEHSYVAASGGSDLSGPTYRYPGMSVATLVYDGSNQKIYDSGVLQATQPLSGTIDYDTTNRHDLLIGSGYDHTGLIHLLNGDVAEVLVYNRALTAAEQQQAEVYLADKYGVYYPSASWPSSYTPAVQAEISRNQWNKAQADSYVAFQNNNPTMATNGLKAWFKSDTGVTQDGSGNITQWSDATGSSTVTQTNPANEPSYVLSDLNAKPALRFNGSEWLSSSASMGTGVNQDMTIVTVAMSSNPAALQSSAFLGSGGAGQNRGIGYDGSQEGYDFGGQYVSGGASQPPSQFVEEAASINSALNAVTFCQNGSQTSVTAVSGVQNVQGGLLIGGSGDQYSPWQGDIAEVLIYDHALSASELQQITQYVSDKYGIYTSAATWPATYAVPIQAEIAKHQWSRDQANAYLTMQAANTTMLTTGLTMWFKADAGVTSSNGQVSAIADQTGNYNLSQSNSTNQPTLVANAINGEPAILFNGSQSLSNAGALATGLNSDMTIITVGMSTDSADQTYSLYVGANNSTGANRATGYSNYEMFDTLGSSCFGGTAPASGTFVAETTTVDGTLNNVAFYQNGVATGTALVSGLQNLTPGISMGAAGGGVDGWQGEIAEQLVYDHKLSPSEMQQVETYLSAKYGLNYSPVAPTLSPSGGNYASTQTVSITSNQSSGVVHYTLDGTVPTANSLTYSGPLTLSSSALVQAAVFSATNGSEQSQVASAQFYVNDPNETGTAPALTGLTTTAVSGSEIDLGWMGGTSGTYSQIYVYRSTNGGAYELLAILSAGDTSFQDITATVGNSYSYEVGTYNQAGVALSGPGSAVSPTAASVLTIQLTVPSGAVPLP